MSNNKDYLKRIKEFVSKPVDKLTPEQEQISEQSERDIQQVGHITKKVKINNALFVMPCPICNNYCASAMEYELLPEFTSCDFCIDLNNIDNKTINK